MTTQPLTLTASHGGIINIDPARVVAVEDSESGTLIYLQGSSAVKVKENRAAVFTAWNRATNGYLHDQPMAAAHRFGEPMMDAAGGYPETHPNTQLHMAAQPA